MSLLASHHNYYPSGNHPTFSGVRSKTCISKMSEPVMEAELCTGRASSSFGRMAGQGEGIYASSTSADVGLQRTDQIGLTLPPKTTSGAKLSLDAFAVSDQDFGEALKQLEPFLAEAKRKTTSFRVEVIHGSRRHYIAPAAKRRKLCGNFYEPLFQKQSSPPVIWSRSPTLNTVLPVPAHFCAENPNHDDGNENLSLKSSELPGTITHNNQEAIRLYQEGVGTAHPSTYRKIESVEEVDPDSIASKCSRLPSTDSCGIDTTGSNCAVLKKDLKGQAGRLKNGQDPEVAKDGTVHGESVDAMRLCHGTVVWDPDVPIQSKEEESPGVGVDCPMDMRRSRSSNSVQVAVCGAPVSFPLPASQTIAGVRSVAANETTRKYVTSQDSLQSSRTSLQTSTLASIASLFLQKSQQALFDGYSQSLSTHQIPAELRARFNALLRKYQSDEPFRKAVDTYAMELSGAVPPDESDPILIPLRLRQAFDTLFKKWRTEEDFRMSVDKFATEFLREKKSSEDISVGVVGPADDKLSRKLKRRNLEGLSMEQLTIYCRELESSRAEHVKTVQSAKEFAKKLLLQLNDKPRMSNHPVERNPNPDTWTCFHLRTKGKDNKEEPCGRSNPHYEKKLIWQETTHCKTCKGPYNEDFKLQKLKTPKKKYPKSNSKADEAVAPDARQTPANAQSNHPANTQANEFRQLSITQQDPLFGATSGQMYGHLAEQVNARHLFQGWHSGIDGRQHTRLSDGFHSTPMGDPFSGINDSTTRPFPMPNTGVHNSSIGAADSLNVNMDFTTPDGEFDEFAIDSDPLFTAQYGEFDEFDIDSDPLFTDMNIDPNMQQPESFLGGTDIFQEDFPQFAQSPEQLADHYPAQVNLFPQHVDSFSQAHDSLSLPRTYTAVGSTNNGAGCASTPLSLQQREYSRSRPPTEHKQSHNVYQSPYDSVISSNLRKSAPSTEALATGTLLSFPERGVTAQLNHASESMPHMQTFLPASHPDHMMTNSVPAIILTDTDSEALMPGVHKETLGSYPWSSRAGRRPSPIPQPRKVQNGRGQGWNASTSPTKKKRAPAKTPRPSRSKAAVAERVALRDARSKTPEVEKPFTEAQLSRVRARNITSAMFIGGPRKLWEEPRQEARPKVIIEILDDNVEVQQEEMEQEIEWEMEVEATQLPQGAVTDHNASEAWDDAFTAEFNAEFDRQAQAAAIEEAADESEISEEE